MTERERLTALTEGADLWLIPALEQSAWSKRIDWYLGFQIRRALPHKFAAMGDNMLSLVGEFEGRLPEFSERAGLPLMIGSQSLLPNKQTVVIPVGVDFVLTCHRVWEGLGRPTARVFLPEGFGRSAFEKVWPSGSGPSTASGTASLELVSA